MEVDGNNFTPFRERRQYRTEHIDRAKPAMQQQERLALAMDLVIIVDAVRRHVAAFPERLLYRLYIHCDRPFLGLSGCGRSKNGRDCSQRCDEGGPEHRRSLLPCLRSDKRRFECTKDAGGRRLPTTPPKKLELKQEPNESRAATHQINCSIGKDILICLRTATGYEPAGGDCQPIG